MLISFQFLLSCLFMTLLTATALNLNNQANQDNSPSAPLPSNGAAVDEVVVESSLYIKPKPKSSFRRKIRRSLQQQQQTTYQFINRRNELLTSLLEHKRVKREPAPEPQPQPRRQQQQQLQQQQEPFYGQSQAAANAAANNQYNNGFNGFGSSAANAQSQAFNAQGPAGSFGASSAGSVTQALNANKFGIQNSAAASMSQVFHLPNGQTINFASANNFANAPGGTNANSRGSAVSVSGG